MEAIGTFVSYLASTGPVGAAIAALVVGLALAVIIFAQVTGIFADRRTGKQSLDFQDRLLQAMDDARGREVALAAENRTLREDVGRLAANVDLLRVQHRRTIDLLRQVFDGKLAPGAINPADLNEAAS